MQGQLSPRSRPICWVKGGISSSLNGGFVLLVGKHQQKKEDKNELLFNQIFISPAVGFENKDVGTALTLPFLSVLVGLSRETENQKKRILTQDQGDGSQLTQYVNKIGIISSQAMINVSQDMEKVVRIIRKEESELKQSSYTNQSEYGELITQQLLRASYAMKLSHNLWAPIQRRDNQQQEDKERMINKSELDYQTVPILAQRRRRIISRCLQDIIRSSDVPSYIPNNKPIDLDIIEALSRGNVDESIRLAQEQKCGRLSVLLSQLRRSIDGEVLVRYNDDVGISVIPNNQDIIHKEGRLLNKSFYNQDGISRVNNSNITHTCLQSLYSYALQQQLSFWKQINGRQLISPVLYTLYTIMSGALPDMKYTNMSWIRSFGLLFWYNLNIPNKDNEYQIDIDYDNEEEQEEQSEINGIIKQSINQYRKALSNNLVHYPYIPFGSQLSQQIYSQLNENGIQIYNSDVNQQQIESERMNPSLLVLNKDNKWIGQFVSSIYQQFHIKNEQINNKLVMNQITIKAQNEQMNIVSDINHDKINPLQFNIGLSTNPIQFDQNSDIQFKDGLYHILNLFASQSYSIQTILDPRSWGRSSIDYRIPFLFIRLLYENMGIGQVSNTEQSDYNQYSNSELNQYSSSSSSIHQNQFPLNNRDILPMKIYQGIIYQLLSIGMWNWALYVVATCPYLQQQTPSNQSYIINNKQSQSLIGNWLNEYSIQQTQDLEGRNNKYISYKCRIIRDILLRNIIEIQELEQEDRKKKEKRPWSGIFPSLPDNMIILQNLSQQQPQQSQSQYQYQINSKDGINKYQFIINIVGVPIEWIHEMIAIYKVNQQRVCECNQCFNKRLYEEQQMNSDTCICCNGDVGSLKLIDMCICECLCGCGGRFEIRCRCRCHNHHMRNNTDQQSSSEVNIKNNQMQIQCNDRLHRRQTIFHSLGGQQWNLSRQLIIQESQQIIIRFIHRCLFGNKESEGRPYSKEQSAKKEMQIILDLEDRLNIAYWGQMNINKQGNNNNQSNYKNDDDFVSLYLVLINLEIIENNQQSQEDTIPHTLEQKRDITAAEIILEFIRCISSFQRLFEYKSKQHQNEKGRLTQLLKQHLSQLCEQLKYEKIWNIDQRKNRSMNRHKISEEGFMDKEEDADIEYVYEDEEDEDDIELYGKSGRTQDGLKLPHQEKCEALMLKLIQNLSQQTEIELV